MYSKIMKTASKPIGCVRAATDIIGDKWTPQLLRFFANEDTVRFCQLQELVGNINPRTLSARLSRLEEQGIIARIHGDSSRCAYQLTDRGNALLPIVRDMQAWSDQYANC